MVPVRRDFTDEVADEQKRMAAKKIIRKTMRIEDRISELGDFNDKWCGRFYRMWE